MKHLFCVLALLPLLCTFAQRKPEAESEELETYLFPASERMRTSSHQSSPFGGSSPFGSANPPETIDFKGLLSQFGVTFPEGSSVEYDPLTASVRMTNTRVNHRKVYEILTRSGVADEQVLLTCTWLTLSEKSVQDLEKQKGEPLSGDDLLALWKKGVAEQVLSQSLTTLNGVNTILETGTSPSAKELIPPLTTNVTVTVSSNELHMTLTLLLYPTEKIGDVKPAVFHGLNTTVFMSMDEHVPVFHTSTRKGERLYFLLHGRIREPKPPPFEKLRLVPVESKETK